MQIRKLLNRLNLLKGADFGVSAFGTLVLITFSAIIGITIYSIIQNITQRNLVRAYQTTNVFCEIFEKNAQLNQGDCESLYGGKGWVNTNKFTEENYLTVMQEAELIRREDVSEAKDLRDFNKHPVPAFLIGKIEENGRFNRLDQCHPTADLVVFLSSVLGFQNPPEFENPNTSLFETAKPSNECRNSDPSSAFNKYLLHATVEGMAGSEKPFSNSYFDAFRSSMNSNSVSNFKTNRKSLTYSLVRHNPDEEIYSFLLSKRGVLPDEGKGGWEANWDSLAGIETPETPPQNLSELDNIEKQELLSGTNKFATFLMGQLHSSDRISKSKTRVVLFRGVEQLLLVIIFVFSLSLIFLRTVRRIIEKATLDHLLSLNLETLNELFPVGAETPRRNKEYAANIRKKLKPFIISNTIRDLKTWTGGKYTDRLKRRLVWSLEPFLVIETTVHSVAQTIYATLRDPSNDYSERLKNVIDLQEEKVFGSAWVIRWSIITLPAVGFIGTVRGILQSLSNADSIVWATNQSERAAAISDISGQLGLAFATTLIALIAGVIVSILHDSMNQQESKFLQNLMTWSLTSTDVNLSGLIRSPEKPE